MKIQTALLALAMSVTLTGCIVPRGDGYRNDDHHDNRCQDHGHDNNCHDHDHDHDGH